MDFPAHPFWDYSLDLYGRPNVADACLALQDQYGLDVNVLLFCVWCGSAGPGVLGADELRLCLSATRDWQQRVVQPLRAVRRYCAGVAGLAAGTLDDLVRGPVKTSVQGVELDAEHVEQLMLASLVGAREGDSRSAAQRAEEAIINLQAYLGALQVELSENVTGYLVVLLGAAFPEISGASLTSQLLRS